MSHTIQFNAAATTDGFISSGQKEAFIALLQNPEELTSYIMSIDSYEEAYDLLAFLKLLTAKENLFAQDRQSNINLAAEFLSTPEAIYELAWNGLAHSTMEMLESDIFNTEQKIKMFSARNALFALKEKGCPHAEDYLEQLNNEPKASKKARELAM